MRKWEEIGLLFVVLVLAITLLAGCSAFRYVDGSSQEQIEQYDKPILWGKVANLEGQENARQQALREQENQLNQLRDTVAKSNKDVEIVQAKVNILANTVVGEGGSQGFEQSEMAKERQSPSTGSLGSTGSAGTTKQGSLLKRVAVLEGEMKKVDADIVTLQGEDAIIREGTMAAPVGSGKEATIKAIRYEKGATGQDKVMVVLDRMTTPEIFSPGGGTSRIVMDFVHTKYTKGLPLQTNPEGLYVQHIRVGKHLKPVQKTRIVLDLVPGKKYFADQVFYEKEKIYAIIIGPQE